jgi:hypothetical protein
MISSSQDRSTKRTRILYWIFTGLLGLMMVASGIPDLLVIPEAAAIFKHLGYPVYISAFLGAAKLLGAIAILVPRFPSLKEWAYAGIFFDFSGALYSHISSGDPASAWAPIFIGFAILFTSYIFFRKRRASGWLTSSYNQQPAVH